MDARSEELRKLAAKLGTQRITRRDTMRLSGAFAGASVAAKLGLAKAQDDSGVLMSITRDEWNAQLLEAFPMTEAESTGGVVIEGDNSDIGTLNGLLSNDQPTAFIINLLFDSLVGNDPNTGLPVPWGLADSWEVSADGLTYTFHLNPNAVWHDGTPVTAADVVFTYDSEVDEASPSSYKGTIEASAESWTAVDDHTVEFKATGVNADFLLDVAVYPIMPKHIWEGVPLGDWATDPGSTGEDPSRVIGSGPFKFVEWIQGDHLTLDANPDYFQESMRPKIDQFIFQILPDSAATVLALQNLEIDLMDRVPSPDIESLVTDVTDVLIYPTFDFNFHAYQLDTAKTDMFQDQGVRQAFMYALDRESINTDIYFGTNEVANGTQSLLSFAYAPDQMDTVYNFDPEKAMALLEEAGWTDADGDGVREDANGRKLAFSVNYPTGSTTTDQVIAYMQEAWSVIGAEMTPAGVEFPELVDIVTNTFDFEVVMLGFSWDASGNQGPMFNSDQYKVGFNFTKYSNPQVDELNNNAKKELDQEARREILIEATNIVNTELPVAVTLFTNDKTGYAKRLQNYYAKGGTLITQFLPYVWIQE